MLFPLVIFVLMELHSRSMVSASEDEHHDLYKKLYDFGLGKRAAYSYVSEYKRLPVYNFGLGKRSPGDERRLYSFGLGKRDYDSEEDYTEDESRDDLEKRMKQYSFGLGKRLQPKSYSFGLGKRPEGKMYSFGLGKRSQFGADYDIRNHLAPAGEDYDSFEESSKRSGLGGNGLKYSFGFGKRGDRGDNEDRSRQGRSMHYNFGLGKRNAPDVVDKESKRSVIVN